MRASKKGIHLKMVILPVLARLALIRWQIGTDMLRIITSTRDELLAVSTLMVLNNLEPSY